MAKLGERVQTFARFRADPSKVKVSVRHCPRDLWVASVVAREDADKEDALEYVALDTTAKLAIEEALRSAAENNLEGVNLDMNRTYPHPWK